MFYLSLEGYNIFWLKKSAAASGVVLSDLELDPNLQEEIYFKKHTFRLYLSDTEENTWTCLCLI